MSVVWDPKDYGFFRAARYGAWRCLEDLDTRHFAQKAPIIAVACSDYRRHHDKIGRIAHLRGFASGEDSQTHPLGWHGGAIRLVQDSPTNYLTDGDAIFMAEVLEAVEITSITDIVTYGHWPCSKAMKHGMKLEDVLRAVIEAKRRLKHCRESLRVRTLFHADFGDLEPGGMRSYFINPDRFESIVSATGAVSV